MDRELVRLTLGAELTEALVAIGAVLARVTPVVWIAPFLGGRVVPSVVRVSLAAVLAIVLAPPLVSSVTALSASPLTLLGLLLKEVLVGAALGFVVSLVFWAAEASGRLVDTARGANLAEVLVPQLGTRSSPLGELYLQLALVIFIALGGHRLVLTALGASYQVLPLGHVPRVSGLAGFSVLCMELTAEVLLLAVSLSAPILAALFLSDLVLGMLNRFVPQLNVFFLAMPAKALVGIALLCLSVGALAVLLPGLLDGAVVQLERALRVLGR